MGGGVEADRGRRGAGANRGEESAMRPNVEARPRQRDFIRAMLSEDHQHLDRLFQEIVASCHAGDHDSMRANWTRFERELTSHMDLEEHEILPAFARAHRSEAQGIRDEHAAIRTALTEMGVDLDLHCLRADRVEAFISLLRAHARREESLLYPWANGSREQGG
jgi:hemerythrin superfamily protein